MQKRFFVVLFIALFSISAAAFAQEATPEATAEMTQPCPAGGSPDAVPAADALKVLTSFTTIADMARNVSCGLLDVQSITKPGTEIHGYEPTPSDLVKTQNANLVLYNGLGLERWFEKFMGSVQGVPSVNLTDGIELVPIAEGEYQDKPNPHAWMSPQNALIYTENIRKAFVALDPANEAAYTANAAAYSAEIQQIDEFLKTNLDQVPAEKRFLVSCEGAFSYLIRDYGMQELYMWPINADQTGTPKQVAKVINGVQDNQIPVVFCESTVNQGPMQEVANQTGAAYGGYLYVDSLTEADGEAPTYLKLLEFDATRIVNGLLGIQ
ncbi:MAG: metal ABC transporter substrate-binding protein [Anaerolineae bacterium]|nr:metal ABC transporter substrate-binding protein [Anaerolineae bacterium]